jgi:hypothetical protein
MKKANQFTITVPNRPGVLGEVASALWAQGVNIQAFLATDVRRGQAVIHLIVDKPAAARRVFPEHGWEATEEEVIVLTLADKPGTLAAVASALADAGINIEYAYTGPARARGKANTYLSVSDRTRALHVLRRLRSA